MTAHELAKKLLEMPDLPVTRRGYEAGVSTITTVNEPAPIHMNTHDEWYYGKHEYCDKDWCSSGEENHQTPSELAIHLD